jgi:predicted metal-dependent HD superfamily phosphohydrolase
VTATQQPLTVAERAALLRCARTCRDQMQADLRALQAQAERGDRVANEASVVLQADLAILEAAIRWLWRSQPP